MATPDPIIEADFIVIGAGSAGCAVAARLSEDPATRVVADRGRRRRQQPLDPHPLGLRQDLRRPERQLVLRDRARPRRRRPPRVLAARQGARRLVVDQRHGLYPRPGRGFRPLAPARQYRLVVGRRAALFPARRRPDPRRRRVPRRRRPALPSPMSEHHPIAEAFIESAASSASRATTISTARSQEGVGYHQTTTRNGRRCSTAVGYLRPAMTAAQPAGRHRGADRKDPVRGQPRHRRRLPPRRRELAPPAPRREIILCGGADQLAATLDAVRHRTRGASGGARHSRWCRICPGSARACRTIIRRRSS